MNTQSIVESEIRRPDSIDGWSGTAYMQTQIPVKQTGIQRDRLAGSGLYTVQFGIVKPRLTGSNGIFSAIGVINWMVAGNAVTRRVSITDGRSISGVGEGVNVYCYDVTPDQGQTPNAPYQIGISVAKGSRPSQNQPPTLTLFDQQFQGLDQLAPSATTLITIPQNAGVISLEVVAATDDSTNTDPSIRVQHVSAGGANVYKSYKLGGGYPGFVPVADNATEVLITNLDSSNSVFISTAWGIDG